jgi:ubiquinol-cytochrome c reductase cytochrome b subunit
VLDRSVHAVEERTRRTSVLRSVAGYVFPEHWSFLWGEIALYCFVVLIATGVYMTLFFDASTAPVVYHGPYAPLRGQEMSRAYASTVHLSLEVRAGLLARQTHHWAADVFLAAITIHLARVFFTGAFRKPREPIFWTGVTLLAVAVLEGYMGYSMIDDLLSGMGLAIGWSVATSIPVIGGPLATLLWDGQFPGGAAFESRLYMAHVLLVPVLMATLIGLHLLLVSLLHHTQFRGARETERNVVGLRLWPAYVPRSLALFSAVVGVLVLMGGLVQINPIWLYGPFHAYLSENGAQPDWYIGWLIGALLLVPNWEPTAFGRTLVPNPFWGGVLFPTVVFATLYAWPVVERRLSGDQASHNLLERPSDNPWRTAFGVAFATWVSVPFFAGSSDRIFLSFGIDYEGQVTVMRVLWAVLPAIVFLATLRICRAARDAGPVEPARSSGAGADPA